MSTPRGEERRGGSRRVLSTCLAAYEATPFWFVLIGLWASCPVAIVATLGSPILAVVVVTVLFDLVGAAIAVAVWHWWHS